jgi:hypothetical protein
MATDDAADREAFLRQLDELLSRFSPDDDAADAAAWVLEQPRYQALVARYGSRRIGEWLCLDALRQDRAAELERRAAALMADLRVLLAGDHTTVGEALPPEILARLLDKHGLVIDEHGHTALREDTV